jgi:peptidoglycan-associated lipoprotein
MQDQRRPTSSSAAALGALAAAALLAACASPTAPNAGAGTGAPASGTAATSSSGTSPSAQAGGVGSGAVSSSAVPTVQARPAPAAPSEASVFFDFDEYVLDGQDSAVVERWGRHLVALPALTLRIEGHTDERGSSEYNLALGQRRAQAVVDALRAYGVATGRIEAVSFGEERPSAAGSDETAWAQNRRADLRPAR